MDAVQDKLPRRLTLLRQFCGHVVDTRRTAYDTVCGARYGGRMCTPQFMAPRSDPRFDLHSCVTVQLVLISGKSPLNTPTVKHP